jgi:hypothetical protein
MAGGTFVTMNKKQPGFYLNMKSIPRASASVGDRGTVVIARSMNWGAMSEFSRLDSEQEAFSVLGYDSTADNMLWLREIFMGTNRTSAPKKLLVWRLGASGAAAGTLTAGTLTATAKYPGTRGNDIYIVVTPDIDTAYDTDLYAVYTVETIVDGSPVDSQTVGQFTDSTHYTAATVGDVASNEWVDFSGTATAKLTPFVGAPLAGGTDGTIAATAYTDFLSSLEDVSFDIVIYDGTDLAVKQAIVNFVKRMSYDFGQYRQAVMANYTAADDPTVISVVNGCVITTGYDSKNNPIYRTLTPEELTWWMGGAQAGATIFESLTYAIKPNAVKAAPVIKPSDRDASIDGGEIALISEFDEVKVLTDINTYHSVTPDKGKAFSKNKIVRMLWMFANDAYKQFSKQYIGQTLNTADGRNLFKGWICNYSFQLQPKGITNFSVDDVQVYPGSEVDSIVINVKWYVVDVVEKIYTNLYVDFKMTITDANGVVIEVN